VVQDAVSVVSALPLLSLCKCSVTVKEFVTLFEKSGVRAVSGLTHCGQRYQGSIPGKGLHFRTSSQAHSAACSGRS